jgi:DNA-binding LacI/PurR family transcriptional regulator
MDAFVRAGIDVPGQISIVGYDDSTLARLVHIDLTTVNQDPAAQARDAVALAVQRLDEGRTARLEIVLNPRLVVRGTTAAVSAERAAPAV